MIAIQTPYQQHQGRLAYLAMLLILLLGSIQGTATITASTASRPHADAQNSLFASTPPITKQFEETSYYLKDTDFISATIGWAVGMAHWDQNQKAYVGTILKTIDGGASWQAQSPPTTATLRNVKFIDANNGWSVGEQGTILHTSDGGASWLRQTVASSDDFRGVSFVNAGQGWASGFHASHYDDSGDADNWQGSIWHSNDGGMSWQKQTLPAGASLLNRIKFIDAQHGWIVGIKYTGDDKNGDPQHVGMVYQTNDGGQSWTELYSPGVHIVLNGVEWVDALHGWVVGFPNNSSLSGGFVFHTADGGQTWQRQTPGDFFSPLWDVQFIDAQRGYVVGFNYVAAWGPPIYRTLDGGATWQSIRMDKHENEGLFAVSVVGDQVIAVGDHDYIVRSSQAWENYTAPPCYDGACLFNQAYLNTHYILHDVFFTDTNNGWAVGSRSFSPEIWGQVILHSSDGGTTWATQYEQAPPENQFSYFRLDSVSFSDAQNGWAVGSSELFPGTPYASHHGAILHTSDGGQHWQEQGQELYSSWDLEFFSVQFLDSQNGWALAAKNFPSDNIFLAHTIDGGNHWSWVDTGLAGTIQIGYATVMGSVLFTVAQHGWAVGGHSQVITTSDGGAHWNRPTIWCADPGSCYQSTLAIGFADASRGTIVGEGLFQTANGGANWAQQNVSIKGLIQDLQFVNPRVGWLASDQGQIWYSIDGGTLWRQLNSKTTFALHGLHMVNEQQGWFVGNGGIILHFASDRLPITSDIFLPLTRK